MAFNNIQFPGPDWSIFQFPPLNNPQTLPPPQAGSTLSAPPFTIPSSWYSGALNIAVPITIATLYATTVSFVNRYNKSRNNKPWGISKTRTFFWFVIAHNVLLAVYSAWTFVGMVGTMRRSLYNPFGPAGFVGTVDSLCKIQGPGGIGNAIAFDPTTSQWYAQSPSTTNLNAAGTPDPTDLGRIWNEGLAFYGWFFYLSKFYEVLDTFIILAKGKRSSTLQTYHHSGAMMCMWAGIRYMSPPIWLFVFLNSAIHALMYTYYTITAFSIRIPQTIKRTLTTMQISQFLLGVSYAMVHSLVTYTIPVQVANTTVSSVAATATSVATSVAAAASSAGVADLVKKMLLRAAGEPGLAENVNVHASPIPITQSHAYGSAVPYHTEYQTVSCIDTSGETFAIWLNVFYLTPLTYLFARFFVKSYIQITSKPGKRRDYQTAAEKAGVDALKGVGRELYSDRKKANVAKTAH